MVEPPLLECRRILMDAPVGVFKSTPQGRYINVNRALALMYGYSSPEEMIEDVQDIASQIYSRPEDRDRFKSTLETYGEIINDECLLHRRDGSEFWVSRSVRAVRDEQGAIIHYYGFVTDITRRKSSEQVLAARERLLSLYQGADHIEMARATVDEAEKLTGSSIGFMHFIDLEENRINQQAWSTSTMKACAMMPEARHYSLSLAGIWKECIEQGKPIIHDSIKHNDHFQRMPAGHIQVNRLLLVPVVRAGKTRALLGLGNKSAGYSRNDILKVQSLSDLAWDLIEYRLARQEMTRLEQLKQLLMDMATRIINIPLEQVDQAINEMLAQVGEFTGVDRTYIF